MTSRDREPMSPELEALLAAERGVDTLDPAVSARVSRAVAVGIGVLPSGGGGGGGAGGSGGAGGAASGGPPAEVGTGGALATAAAKGLAGAKLAIALVAAGAAGAIAGVGTDRALARREAPPVVTPAVDATAVAVPAATTIPKETATPAVEVPTSPAALPPPATPPAPHTAAEPSAKGLAAERALLDVARAGLAQGDPGTALRAAERHAHEYPDGALAEERDAMRVKALMQLGRAGEARRRAADFEQRYPTSLQLRAVRSAVE